MSSAPKGDRSLSCGGQSAVWTDPQGRRLDYLRLAITDRCNLRCRYCMPESGLPATGQLSLSELERACRVLVAGGIRKIRITGGEPLARRGVLPWIKRLAALEPRPEILLTTNGVFLEQALPQLLEAGLARVNLSLDTLDPGTWKLITRRDGFAAARRSVDSVLDAGVGLKINVVVQPGVNDGEIADFVDLTRERPVTVRFIEPMPFTGSDTVELVPVSGDWILERVARRFAVRELPRGAGDVDRRFEVEGHVGAIGIIEGSTRSFCADCCRLRLNARGELRTCLYGSPAADLSESLRSNAPDWFVHDLIAGAISHRLEDGRAAEAARTRPVSMAEVGG